MPFKGDMYGSPPGVVQGGLGGARRARTLIDCYTVFILPLIVILSYIIIDWCVVVFMAGYSGVQGGWEGRGGGK